MKKFHLGIYGLIEKDEKILLIKKLRGPYVNMFDLPGGRPEHGESIFQTLKREIKEETGIKIRSAKLFSNEVFIVPYIENNIEISLHHTALIYKIVEFDHKNFMENIKYEDAVFAKWVPKAELKKTPLSRVVECVFNYL